MAFGENVGSAYVRLYANGDDVPDDIRKSLDKLDKVAKEAGEEHAEKYDKAFQKQIDKDGPETRDRLYKQLQKGLGRMDAIGQQLGEDFFDGLQLEITRQIDDSDLGRLIRDKLEEDFALTGSFDRLAASLKDINRLAIQSQKELNRLNEDELRDAIRNIDGIDTSTREWEKTVADTKGAMRELAEEIDSGWEVTNKWVAEIAIAREEERRFVDGFQSRLHTLNVELDKSATLTGKIFGKGSRNDFLNLVGSTVEGLTRLVYSVPNLAERLFGGGGGGSSFSQIAGSFASSIVGITIAVAALITVLGPVAALVSGLSASVISLVGSLGFAASAVGGVAFALAGPLVAGVAIAVGAFKNLDDETVKVLNGLKKDFLELNDIGAEALGPGLRDAIGIVRPHIADLEPLFRGVGEAVGSIATRFAGITEGSAYERFISVFSRFVPNAMESLGDSAANLTEALMGVWRASTPQARIFLGWLEDITERFNTWANSAEGQTELRDFFAEAAESAQSVWAAIRDVSEAVVDLLDLGRDSGDNIFDSLADNAQRLVDYLADPKNRESIEEFFKNGEQFAYALGNLVVQVGELIEDLDTTETRQQLQDLFSLVGNILGVVGALAPVVEGNWTAIRAIVNVVGEFFSAVAWGAEETADAVVDLVTAPLDAIDNLMDAAGDVDWGGLYDGFRGVLADMGGAALGFRNDVIGWFRGMGGRITNAVGNINWSRIIQNPIPRVLGFFAGLAGRITARIGDVNWSRIIPNPIQNILGWFSGLAGDIVDEIGTMSWTSIIPNPVDNIVGWFTGLAGRILNAIGTIDIGSLIKIPDPGGGIPFVPGLAAGGTFGDITNGPRLRWIGEDGPEAIVPLNRPLSQVDPSVRELSAIAQGLRTIGRGSERATVVEDGAIRIIGVDDGGAAAIMAINELVAKVG